MLKDAVRKNTIGAVKTLHYYGPREEFDAYLAGRKNWTPGQPISAYVSLMKHEPVSGKRDFEQRYTAEWNDYLHHCYAHGHSFIASAHLRNRDYWSSFEASVTPDNIYTNDLWLRLGDRTERFNLLARPTIAYVQRPTAYCREREIHERAVQSAQKQATKQYGEGMRTIEQHVDPWLKKCIDTCVRVSTAADTTSVIQKQMEKWSALKEQLVAHMVRERTTRVIRLNRSKLQKSYTDLLQKLCKQLHRNMQHIGAMHAVGYIEKQVEQAHKDIAESPVKLEKVVAASLPVLRAMACAAFSSHVLGETIASYQKVYARVNETAQASSGWGESRATNAFEQVRDDVLLEMNSLTQKAGMHSQNVAQLTEHATKSVEAVVYAVAAKHQIEAGYKLLLELDTAARKHASDASPDAWVAELKRVISNFYQSETAQENSCLMATGKDAIERIYDSRTVDEVDRYDRVCHVIPVRKLTDVCASSSAMLGLVISVTREKNNVADVATLLRPSPNALTLPGTIDKAEGVLLASLVDHIQRDMEDEHGNTFGPELRHETRLASVHRRLTGEAPVSLHYMVGEMPALLMAVFRLHE